MSSSNCCFLNCIQISQEAGQVVWYSYLFKNVAQFVVIHTVKGFCVFCKAEDVFLELSCLFNDPRILAIWSLAPLSFLNTAWTSRSLWFRYCWSLAWRILSITLLACDMRAIVRQFEHFFWHCLSSGLEWKLTFSSSHVWMCEWDYKVEHQITDTFELWCWSRFLRVPWTARRSN